MINDIILFLASFLIWIMFLGLGILWFIDGRIRKEQVLHSIFASFIAWIVAEFIKQAFHIARPFQVNGLKPLTITTPLSPAFPSSHAAVVFALAVTVWFHNKKAGLL